MREDLEAEIAELQREYRGLTRLREAENGVVVSGTLPFEASSEGRETIADVFEIDLTVPRDYPTALPWVRETSGRICEAYDHVFTSGKLCLAVPVEERLRFGRDPSLRGFVTNLLIPVCYGYCFWERHGVHPFGEREHGGEGIARFYIDWLGLPGEVQALEVALHLVQHGYRGHHDCPCGSGARLRDCHGPAILELHRTHTVESAQYDLGEILRHCMKKLDDGGLVLPVELKRRLLRQGNRMARRPGFRESQDRSERH